MSRRLLLVVALACALFACGPSMPTGSLDEVVAISGGEDLTCAHRRDGSMWCWGDGALTGGGSSAYAKATELSGIEAASAFGGQVCVILQDRSVACSEAGFGLFNPSWAPVPARAVRENDALTVRPGKLGRVSGLDDVAQVGVGVYIDCVRRHDGTVACWGDAAEVLRTGTYDRTRPPSARVANGFLVADVGGIPGIVDLSVGDWSALAIGEDGSAWTLGGLARGALRVPGITDAVEGVSGRSFHCVRRKGGEVSCWRNGTAPEPLGKLANTPQKVDIGPAKKLAAGPWGVCATLEDGDTACWGGDQHVTQARSSSWLTTHRISSAQRLQQIVVGAFYACGLTERGNVVCWGDARRLGIGFEASRSAAKIPQTIGYVQPNAAGEAIAQAQRNSWFTAGAALAGIVLALAWSRRLAGRMTEAWRRLPSTPIAAGSGYRASEVAVNRAGAPRGLHAAMLLALASAGADSAFVVVFDRLMSSTGKAICLLGLVASAAWIVVVLASVSSAARGSRSALRRWRTLGVLGVLGHANLGYLAFAARDMLAWHVAGKHVVPPSMLALMIEVVQAASVFGVVASVGLVLGARYSRELP